MSSVNVSYSLFKDDEKSERCFVKKTSKIQPIFFAPFTKKINQQTKNYIKSKCSSQDNTIEEIFIAETSTMDPIFSRFYYVFLVLCFFFFVCMIYIQNLLDSHVSLSDQEFKQKYKQRRQFFKTLVLLCKGLFGLCLFMTICLFHDWKIIQYTGSSTSPPSRELFNLSLFIQLLLFGLVSLVVVASLVKNNLLLRLNILMLVTIAPIFILLLFYREDYILPTMFRNFIRLASLIFIIVAIVFFIQFKN
jgi:hypothetical protein